MTFLVAALLLHLRHQDLEAVLDFRGELVDLTGVVSPCRKHRLTTLLLDGALLLKLLLLLSVALTI